MGPNRQTITDAKALIYVSDGLIVRGEAEDRQDTVGLVQIGPTTRRDGRSSMVEYGFGLVGCGMIAEFHTRAINEIPGCRVVAAFSRARTNAEKIAGMAGHGCAIHDDLDAMLAHPGLDIVCICTPSGAHRDPAVKSARAGKHVVVEKPLEITLARCDSIIEACDSAGVRLCTIFPSRFTPANIRLKEAITGGRFGRSDPGRHLREVVADPGVL